jgi:hypothetical protein
MNNYETYMNDPDIMSEPKALREIHAIRLLIQEETKNMTDEERVDFSNREAERIIREHGLTVRRLKTKSSVKESVANPFGVG